MTRRPLSVHAATFVHRVLIDRASGWVAPRVRLEMAVTPLRYVKGRAVLPRLRHHLALASWTSRKLTPLLRAA